MKRSMIAAILLVLGTASTSIAETDAAVAEAIQVIISNRHPNDTAETWRGLGSNAPKVIISIYQSSDNTYQKMRLIHGLGWFDDPSAVDFLKQQAQSATEEVIRDQAIHAIGTSQGAKEADYIGKFLGSNDPQTRIAAAETLKAMNDPHANQMVAQYLTEEKAPWIVQKIKGQLPSPPLKLKPVSSSEDKLSPQFAGLWKGFWIIPLKASTPGEKNIQSLPALFRVKAEATGEISGDLTVESKKNPQTWTLKNVEGKASRLKGILSERVTPPKPGQPPTIETPFEADLTEETETPLIRLRATRFGATLVVRKSD